MTMLRRDGFMLTLEHYDSGVLAAWFVEHVERVVPRQF